MLVTIEGALMIAGMRICDMTIDTFRVILVMNGRKYLAGIAGFVEILIWIFAMKYVVQHMDTTINLFGYALGYGIGNILGLTIDEKIAIGYTQLTIFSIHHSDSIADRLRAKGMGVTILPGEGATGGVLVLLVILKRKELKEVIELVENLDKGCFITIQNSRPLRGFIHGDRK